MSTKQLKAYQCTGQLSLFDIIPEHNFFIRQQLTRCEHCNREYDKRTVLHICKPSDLKEAEVDVRGEG